MESNQAYSAAEVERMMKLPDTISKAMAKKISWIEAAVSPLRSSMKIERLHRGQLGKGEGVDGGLAGDRNCVAGPIDKSLLSRLVLLAQHDILLAAPVLIRPQNRK